MTCPFCQELINRPVSVCWACGANIVKMESGIMKTSTVMVACDGERAVYSSVRDVPEPVKTRLLRTMQGDNAGTIVIADEGGRKRIERMRAMVRSGDTETCALPRVEAATPPVSEVVRHRWGRWIVGGALAATSLAALGVWIAFHR